MGEIKRSTQFRSGCGTGFIALRIGSVVGSCEYSSNALSSYVKGGNSLEYMRKY
jgi:hypothetical protein